MSHHRLVARSSCSAFGYLYTLEFFYYKTQRFAQSNKTLYLFTMFTPTRLMIMPRTCLSAGQSLANRISPPSTRGMATKKAGGSSNNGRDSIGRRLGIKVWPNQQAVAGNILVRRTFPTLLSSCLDCHFRKLTLYYILCCVQNGAKSFGPAKMSAWAAIIPSLPRWTAW